MLTKELSHIDWSKRADTIHNLVRGLSPWPVASTVYHNKLLKIHKSKVVNGLKGNAGQIVDANGLFLSVAAKTRPLNWSKYSMKAEKG